MPLKRETTIDVPQLHKKPFLFSQQGKFILLCLSPAVLLVTVFIYYPVLKGVIMAFQNYTLFDLTNIYFNGLQNFKDVVASRGFTRTLVNSFYWVFISLLFQFSIGFMLALMLKKKFRGRGIYQAFIFFPWAMSGFLIGLIWRWLFNGQVGVINDLLMKTGLTDQMIPFLSQPNWAMASVIIANIWYGIPFFAIMILSALQSIPNELYKASQIDGAGYFRQLFNITIPYILPVLVATTLLRVIWILNFPDLIYAMTNGGPAGSTHILSTFMLDKIIFDQNYGQAGAMGVMIIALLFLFTVFYLFATKYQKAGDF